MYLKQFVIKSSFLSNLKQEKNTYQTSWQQTEQNSWGFKHNVYALLTTNVYSQIWHIQLNETWFIEEQMIVKRTTNNANLDHVNVTSGYSAIYEADETKSTTICVYHVPDYCIVSMSSLLLHGDWFLLITKQSSISLPDINM